MGFRSGLWLLLASVVAAQTVAPSNNSGDLLDPARSPRFIIDASGSVKFPRFTVAPLGQYARIGRTTFIGIKFPGQIVNTDATNANQVQSSDFNFVSCDPEHYEGGNLDANALLRIITTQQWDQRKEKSSLIFYSTRSNHCNATDFNNLPTINGIFTTLDPTVASQIANMNFTRTSNAQATLTADGNSFYQAAIDSGQPTTAIAMIILYSITGIITALFVVIIITGAVRAHRHPERYGPRSSPGRPRQSRAKGIARAMLETLPIVKFGDHHDLPKDKDTAQADVELANNTTVNATKNVGSGDKSATVTTTAVGNKAASTSGSSKGDDEAGKNADGSDAAGVLGCSICTEDFQKGEEVRVLPCNHKFHPDCVDPWLLNVSGTCPLCRISLAPEGEQQEDGTANANGDMPPPLAANAGDRRSQAIHNLMAMAYGSREERISALRRYRADRQNRNQTQNENDEEQISRARRFRDAFRIRTRRHDLADADVRHRDPGIDAISGPQMRI